MSKRKSDRITAHGIVRFLERYELLPLDTLRKKFPGLTDDGKILDWLRHSGVDVTALAEQIVDDEMEAALKAGVSAFVRDGFTFVAQNGRIVTVLAPGQRPKHRGRYKGHHDRMREAAL